MKKFYSLVILLVFALITQCYGETGTTEAKSPTAPENSPFPIKNYSGDFCARPNLLGDWGGERNELAKKGITFETRLTQTFQGNARGGKDTSGAWGYSGNADYYMYFDTQRMGLWPAGQITIHGETAFGNSSFGSVGSIMPVNYGAMLPQPDNPGLTTLSEVYLTQFFSKKFGIMLGKLDLTAIADNNIFASDHRTQFLNTSFKINPVLFPYGPYTPLCAGASYMPNDNILMSLFIVDTNASVTRSGFDTAFHSPQGTTIGAEWDLKVKPCDLPGNQRIGAAYTNKKYTRLEQNWGVVLPQGSSAIKSKEGTSSLWYNFDQYLYVEKDDPSQGIGVFGRYGFADEETNPIQSFYSFGVGGKGIFKKRDNDTFGLGYYYLDLSDNLPGILNISSEQGVELFYNFEITKSIHITPDIQWIKDPGAGSGGRDNAVVLGCRLQMTF